MLPFFFQEFLQRQPTPPRLPVLFNVQNRECPTPDDKTGMPSGILIEMLVVPGSYAVDTDIDRGVKIAIIRPIGKVGKVGRSG